ncbi:hypothetical protein [Luteolibacter sp. Populi]|uniref:hypothetical protein n=1 Tax=Luteolibacter sp. Populi TaxID=3230487 RepID=UPI0034666CD9
MDKENSLAEASGSTVSLAPSPAVEGRSYLRTEARVRGLGLLFFGLAPVFALLILVHIVGDRSSGMVPHAPKWIPASLFLLAALSVYVGVGLRCLNPRARVAGAAIACLALFFPYGAVATFWTIWVLYSRTTKTVFSTDYRRMAAEAGRQRPELSWLDTFGLVLLVPVLSIGVMLGLALMLYRWY